MILTRTLPSKMRPLHLLCNVSGGNDLSPDFSQIRFVLMYASWQKCNFDIVIITTSYGWHGRKNKVDCGQSDFDSFNNSEWSVKILHVAGTDREDVKR